MKITVSVHPNANRNLAVINGEYSLRVWLTAKPLKGKANQALINFLKQEIRKDSGTPPRIEMVRGETSKQKVLEVGCDWDIIKKVFISHQDN